ncbi:F-actin capping protein, beta subunit [Hyphopichia burtonii NRRL Y-1933]|uniref:F-actin-capping protein subunit beta n=1 Tax=Hyphopichia burtonii NRRL Y-1933 TaxID=984485 RepID=A0A1E4RBT6_9ASCO|nr:F-actin capping protein, beta subunit [Hyphopichia burtonii NRRL Y-1933]ODV64706.1 F-actin capping protein, beta subunit [Hyphopichia burtonii NRRL Y-1933]
MSYDDRYDASLDLLRRLDPKDISKNLNDICTLIQNDSQAEAGENEDLTQDLLSSVDIPLKVAKCKESGKDYLCCDYNRDGDSYRSPWSNKYYPTVTTDEAPPYPSNILRQLELKANESFDIYRDLYYDGAGASSVYLWDTAEEETEEEDSLSAGFAGVVLFKKETEDNSGKWDSIHVFEVIPEGTTSATYKLTSSVILDLQNSSKGSLSLSGNLTRQIESSQHLSLDGGVNLETAHLINLGTLIEKSESNVRNLLQEVYFDKLKNIMLRDLRSVGDLNSQQLDKSKQSELIKGLQGL